MLFCFVINIIIIVIIIIIITIIIIIIIIIILQEFAYSHFDRLEDIMKTRFCFQSCDVHEYGILIRVGRGWEERVHNCATGAVCHPSVTGLTFLKISHI